MHSQDRHWRATSLVLTGLVALGLAVLSGLFTLSDFSLPTMLQMIDGSSCSTWWTIFSFAAFAALIPYFVKHYVVLAGQREQCRKLALTGDYNAMPIVKAQVDESLAARESAAQTEPLTLRWRNGENIAATTASLLWRRRHKRDVVLAWGEARLLERWDARNISKYDKVSVIQYGYCLYANCRKFIEWTDAPEDRNNGQDLSLEQQQRLHEEFLAIVMARTGLPLRAVARGGKPAPRQKSDLLSRFSLSSAAFVLAIPSLPLATAILALVAPLTHVPALNIYTAVTLGAAGLMLLRMPVITIWRTIWPPPPRSADLPISLPPAPVLPRPDAPIAIKTRSSIEQNPRVVLLSLLVVGNIYPLIGAIQEIGFDQLGHGDLVHLPKLTAELLMLCLACDILVLCAFSIGCSSTLLADEEGLHWRYGKKQQSIAWSDISSLHVSVSSSGTLESFALVEEPSTLGPFDWPANARWVNPPEGAAPDNAGTQFAAIVAQRAGVQPTTQWE